MSSIQGSLMTAGNLVSQNASITNKIYQAALKATRSKLTQIEQAMLDSLNGTDMTMYAF